MYLMVGGWVDLYAHVYLLHIPKHVHPPFLYTPPTCTPPISVIGIVAVTNPLHLVSDWRMMHARLGSTRAGPKRAYAFRSLLSAGVHQAFGSDWPVVGMDCIGAMHVAVHRVAPHGNDHHDDDDYGHMPVWAAEERTTAEEALLAHTAWAAEACSAGDARIGSLRYMCGLGNNMH